ncbi:MAG: phage integrase SAM-like domain-containing protein, partial [Butyricicoccus sp.]
MKRKPLRVTATLQEKANRFYIVARIPTVDGSYQQKWLATGLPIAGNKRRAKLLLDQKLLELQADYERQNRRAGWATSQVGDVPFVEVLDRWMMRKRIEVAASTFEGYQRILVRLRPYFERAGLTTNEVSPSVIEEYMDLLLRDGLSANTVRHHLTLLKTVFNDEIRNGAPLLNPVKCVKPPRMNEFSGST